MNNEGVEGQEWHLRDNSDIGFMHSGGGGEGMYAPPPPCTGTARTPVLGQAQETCCWHINPAQSLPLNGNNQFFIGVQRLQPEGSPSCWQQTVLVSLWAGEAEPLNNQVVRYSKGSECVRTFSGPQHTNKITEHAHTTEHLLNW